MAFKCFLSLSAGRPRSGACHCPPCHAEAHGAIQMWCDAYARHRPQYYLSSLFLISGSKYSSNINEIDKSEQKSSPDATGKGIPYEWPQNDSGCKYHIVIHPPPHHMFVMCVLKLLFISPHIRSSNTMYTYIFAVNKSSFHPQVREGLGVTLK